MSRKNNTIHIFVTLTETTKAKCIYKFCKVRLLILFLIPITTVPLSSPISRPTVNKTNKWIALRCCGHAGDGEGTFGQFRAQSMSR